MTELINTIDGKKLYADRALKDANGKQIDTTYAEAPVILKYGQAVTQSKEQLTELFKLGRLYVLYDDTKVFPCTATWAGYIEFWFTESATVYTTEITRIKFDVKSSSWSMTTDDMSKVTTRSSNGATGYLGDVLKAGLNISTEFDSRGNLVISAANQRIGLVVNQTPSYSINEILGRFYNDATYAFDPTSIPVRTYAQVKSYPSENKVVYGRTDGTTRQEYTLTYVDDTYTWTYAEYELQTKLTFDDAPTSGSSNPVTSSGIKSALDTKQNDISDIIPTDTSSTNQLASKAYVDAGKNVILTYGETPTQSFSDLTALAAKGLLYARSQTTVFQAVSWSSYDIEFLSVHGRYTENWKYHAYSGWSIKQIDTAKVASQSGQTPDYLGNVLKAGQNITITTDGSHVKIDSTASGSATCTILYDKPAAGVSDRSNTYVLSETAFNFDYLLIDWIDVDLNARRDQVNISYLQENSPTPSKVALSSNSFTTYVPDSTDGAFGWFKWFRWYLTNNIGLTLAHSGAEYRMKADGTIDKMSAWSESTVVPNSPIVRRITGVKLS